jgi:subtilisin family serine protease
MHLNTPEVPMKALHSVFALSLLALASAASASGRGDEIQQQLREGRAHESSEMLVQFKPGADAVRALGHMKAQKLETLRRTGQSELMLVKLAPGLAVADAVRAAGQMADVEFAEPNWRYTHQVASNDLYYTNGTLWGMYGSTTTPQNQFGSGAGAAASNNCGSVWVGIIDEGYMHAHEDLAANAGTNPGEIAGNGIDDDGNGYVDDVNGWDFDGNNSSVFDGAGDDHGTHVAGTIGGAGNNAKGVSGVCHSVKMIGAKFLGSRGGTTANAIKSVDYMTDLKSRHSLNLVATNNSWGGGGFSQALQDAIERANQAGILFIAAAGNSSLNCTDAAPCYPASYPNSNIISVASITNTGAMSSFSNYGATHVDICAPGSAIMSTVPKSSKGKVISGYASYSGTSMATPHVAGAAALYKARNPSATMAQVKGGLLNSSTPTSSCNGKVSTGGRLNVSGF